MKLKLILLILLFSQLTFSQIKSGFVKEEARDLIALFCSYTFLELYGSDKDIVPKGYKKRYTSHTYALDNKFQVYSKGKIGVINLRGSTDKKPSWLENLYVSMIPTKGIVEIENVKYPYDFNMHDSAAVHSGYLLGVTYLLNDLLPQLKLLNAEGIYDIYITGHSQGGALAQVLRVYLDNLNSTELSKKNRYKSYAFASPKIGNKEFTEDFNRMYKNETSFNVVNSEDIVPTLPLSYSDKSFVTKNEIKNWIFDSKNHKMSDRVGDGEVRAFKGKIKQLSHVLGNRTGHQIKKNYSDVVLPDEVRDINYKKVGKMVSISPSEYPKSLKDSIMLENKEFMENAKYDQDGNLANDDLYNTEPMFFQHNPYNYYVTILKTYFPQEYKKLKVKVLPENL